METVKLHAKFDYQTLLSQDGEKEMVKVYSLPPWTFQLVLPGKLAERIERSNARGVGDALQPSVVFDSICRLPDPNILRRVCIVPSDKSSPPRSDVEVYGQDLFVRLASQFIAPDFERLLGGWASVFLTASPMEKFFHGLASVVDASETDGRNLTLSGEEDVSPANRPAHQIWCKVCADLYSGRGGIEIRPATTKVVARALRNKLLDNDYDVMLPVQTAALSRLEQQLEGWDQLINIFLISTIRSPRKSVGCRIAALKLLLIHDEIMSPDVEAELAAVDARELDLSFEPWSNADLQKLSRLRSLEVLNLTGTHVDSEGLDSLKLFPRLRGLSLRKLIVHDDGLIHLTRCELEELDLSETFITDEGVPFIGQMKRLKKLRLQETKLTAKGIGKLRSDLPNCAIDSGD